MDVGKPSGVKKATELQQSLSFVYGYRLMTPEILLATKLGLV
jgi:hypothetical protein